MPGNTPIQVRIDAETMALVDAMRGELSRARYVRAALVARLTADLERQRKRLASPSSSTNGAAVPGGCDLSKYPLPVQAPGQYL